MINCAKDSIYKWAVFDTSKCVHVLHCVMHVSKVISISGQNRHSIFLRTSYLHPRAMHLLISKLRVTKNKGLKGL